MRSSDWSSDVCSSDLRALPSEQLEVGAVEDALDQRDHLLGFAGVVLAREQECRALPTELERRLTAGAMQEDLMRAAEVVPEPHVVLVPDPVGLVREPQGGHPPQGTGKRSEERRGGKAGVRTCQSRWQACHYKKKQ